MPQARQEYRSRRYPDGSLRYLRVSGEPIVDVSGRFTGYRGVGRDVTAQKVAEERVQYRLATRLATRC